MNIIRLIPRFRDMSFQQIATQQMAESKPCIFKAPEDVLFENAELSVKGKATCLRSGLGFYQLHVTPHRTATLFVPLDEGYYFMVSVLSGQLVVNEGGHRQVCEKDTWAISAGNRLSIEITKGSSVHLFCFVVHAEVFKSMFTEDRLKESPLLNELIGYRFDEPLFIRQKCSDRLLHLNHWIKEPSNAVADRLMLESRCLEWLSEVSQQKGEVSANDSASHFKDEAKIRKVAAYLESNLTVETSLAALSRQFGLNEFKLKQGFREVYQTTVFKYLKSKRIEEAERLLRVKEYSVIEIANRVGYTNPGHFASAFKERFGLLPKAYQCIHRERQSSLSKTA